MKWYKIASKRVDSVWWNAVLTPLMQLESGATDSTNDGLHPSANSSSVASRHSLEDMELETRALTEPLPTNQQVKSAMFLCVLININLICLCNSIVFVMQAYKSHRLYAIERWLNKHQIIYPKGPVLGVCSGHPVYPRTCVRTLKTKERWLREALQVKANEQPAKVIN